MDVFIEKYRGIDIIFSPDNERFSYSIDTGNWSDKQSFAACKKSIDEYLKANNEFKPFFVTEYSTGRKIKIIGIRKDNRFIYENNKGEKDQISQYDEAQYIVFDDKHETFYATIAILELEKDEINKKIAEQRKLITGETLKDLKENYSYKV